MSRWVIGLAAALVSVTLVASDAEARRLGGARSLGTQKNVASPPASPPARQAQPAAPAQQQAAPAAQGAPGAAAAAGGSKWMPLLGGLALGGLLGWMLSGTGLGVMLLVVLLAIAAVMLVRSLARARAAASAPLQYAGLGNETVAAPPPSQAGGLEAPSRAPRKLPEDFDLNGFLHAAKLNFVRLQIANDEGQLEQIREFTTPELYAQLEADVRERAGARQQTDVVALEAQLLELATEAGRYWASVRFSGLVRETPTGEPEGFAEIWNLAKPLDGTSGWLLAGIQQTH